FDLWWSSLAVQWCDTRATLTEAARVLRADGRLALSTLGAGTFAEMRTAFAEVDRHRHTLDFSAAESLVAAAQAAGLREPELTRETLTLHYPDLGQLLGAVKAIGANALGEGRRRGMMGKAAWQALTAAYERQRTAEGLPASYDVILLTARK
ncbi:MAG: malonyl-[acyl-carrier protein] O-methyltransferase BioC, partial [Azospira sp.]|nr:malonyl-[acyl-carrier protein] O-methyltransferase BioC [Azospira sp.]